MRRLAQLRYAVRELLWPLADDAAAELKVRHDTPTAAEHAVAQAEGAVHSELVFCERQTGVNAP